MEHLMVMTTRKRDLPFIKTTFTRWRRDRYDYYKWNQSNYGPYEVIGTQETRSEGHPFPRKKGSGEDLGGNFYTHRDFYNGPMGQVSWEGGNWRYQGPFLPTAVSFSGLAVPSSNQELDALGTTAIARVKPLNPCVDGATALGELREGLPNLIGAGLTKSKLKDYRKVGDEYLNAAFGWAPLVSDIGKLVDTVSKSEKILAQLYRDAGRNIRRRYAFPPDETTVVSIPQVGYGNPTGFDAAEVSPGIVHSQTVTRRERWFSGAFTYHIDAGRDALSNMNRWAFEARALYGIRVTPDVLWNLAPWSWAADYFGNIGDYLNNISSFSDDGLVLRYGYIMEKTTSTVTTTLSGHRLGGVAQPDLTIIYGRETKVRRVATPYGFGLNLDGLQPRQWAILAALGISKGPGRLSS
jgi:hypothetical protein